MTMTMENFKETLLRKNNFQYNVEESAWKKPNWIIRFDEDNIEVYNDPINKLSKNYYCEKYSDQLLIDILDDIYEIDHN